MRILVPRLLPSQHENLATVTTRGAIRFGDLRQVGGCERVRHQARQGAGVVFRFRGAAPRHQMGGVMATAGGLLFYGDGSNSLVAADLKSGKVLWHFYAGQGWRAGPMSSAIDGRQYIGATAGSIIMVFGLP